MLYYRDFRKAVLHGKIKKCPNRILFPSELFHKGGKEVYWDKFNMSQYDSVFL